MEIQLDINVAVIDTDNGVDLISLHDHLKWEAARFIAHGDEKMTVTVEELSFHNDIYVNGSTHIEPTGDA